MMAGGQGTVGQERLNSEWQAVSSRRLGIVGYLEVFRGPRGLLMSVPGVSRWVDGPELVPSRARAIPD
jgi:hypothetical protein